MQIGRKGRKAPHGLRITILRDGDPMVFRTDINPRRMRMEAF
jgi:hypothetical protein